MYFKNKFTFIINPGKKNNGNKKFKKTTTSFPFKTNLIKGCFVYKKNKCSREKRFKFQSFFLGLKIFTYLTKVDKIFLFK